MSPARRATGKLGRRPRGSLSEEEIINAAAALVERDGVGGLSMPKLAKDLNAGVMSMYWYFRSKDDLLAAMADRAVLDVFSRLPPVSGRSWVDEVINVLTALQRELRATSLYLKLCRARPRSMVLRPAVIPVLAPRLEAELQLLQRAGVDAGEATRLLAVLNAYSRGFALMQLGADDEGIDETPEQAFETSVAQLNPAKFPTLSAVSDVGAVVSVSDDRFDAGLRLLVAGMQAELERSGH